MSLKPWKTLSSREAYKNKWLRLREDIAELPNGKQTLYGVIELGHCVGMLPFVDDEHVVLVRQFRYVFGEDNRWEMPTGGMEEGENPLAAAQRELMEEIHYRADSLTWINSFYSSKSVTDEVCHLYIARGLTPAELPPDDTEFLEIGVFPFAEVVEMVLRSEIRDVMTVTAVLIADRMRTR
ncbi:MAG: NUDIX hydrolase [Anaerolineae bacterium]|nr:NUDIX hydrolase [Anaerolineae bacterium]